jgi:hypothetical protein
LCEPVALATSVLLMQGFLDRGKHFRVTFF